MRPDVAPGLRLVLRDGPSGPVGAPAALDAVQRWMLSALLSPRSAADDATAETLLLPSDSLAAADRLDVYRGMAAARFEATLAADFGAVAAVVGPRRFEEAVAAYVRVTPPRSFTLARLGDRFPEFLAAHASIPPRRRAALADLARLERAVARVAVEPETEPVPASALARVAPDAWAGAVLVPVPHLAVEALAHDALASYEAYVLGTRPPLPRRRPGAVAVVRRAGHVRRVPLSVGEHALLGSLFSGVALGDAVDAHPDVAAGPLLQRAFAAGLFADVDLG